MPHIPLVDLGLQHRAIAGAVAQGFARVVETASFVQGQEVRAFEEAFARFEGVPHCVSVASGTDALELALRALGIEAGDEVIVPANSFVASALAVVRAGAVPVLADCDPRFLLIDPDDAARRITPRTRAIVPVHLYGQLAPIERLRALAEPRGIALVEDAAQAHGARRHGAGPAAATTAAGTSFYPSKNLGGYGDGGAVLTASDQVARRVRALGNYGGEGRHDHRELGFNSRLDTLQAVVLMAKLTHLAAWNEARREAARRYDALLAGGPAAVPAIAPGNEHVFHLYVVRVPDRDAVMARLRAAGIGAAVHYPTPIHLQGAFRPLGHAMGDFPVAERASREVLSLPLYPGITEEQQERVAVELRRALR